MSSTLNKITDKLTGRNKEQNDVRSSNFGPHSSAAANKIDPTVDSDLDGRSNPASSIGGYGHTQHAGAYGANNNNGIGGTQQTALNPGVVSNPHSTNDGPHKSNLANKIDPRVDSGRDGRNNPASHVGGYGNTQTVGSYDTTGASGIAPAQPPAPAVSHGQPGGVHHHSNTAGPHNSNLANKLDPRVDSDLDGRNNPHPHTGGVGTTHLAGSGTYQGSHTGAQGYTGASQTANHPHSTNTGPHSSNLLNKLDPRVDSDRDGRDNPASHTGGYGQTQTGHGVSGTHVHGSGTGNYGVSTNVGAQGYTGTNTTYDNPKSTNTGPHSSNLLNKLDPRVDSDRDGRDNPLSNTGGYGQSQTGSVGRY